MPTWSTDAVASHERFDYWREVRARNLFGVTAELDREKHAGFRGEFSVQRVGSAALVEMHASSYRVRRSEDDIARAPSDSFCIYQQLGGASWFDAGRGGEFITRAGSFATSYTDLPYATTPTTDEGFHLRLVKIPFGLCQPGALRAADLAPRPLMAEPGLQALVASYFNALVEQAPYLTGAAADMAVQTLAQLAFAARGVASLEDEPGRDAVRAGRLEMVRQFIDANLHRASLTPAQAARALGISVRQLHLLFEPSDTSFSRHVLARRLERARYLLARHTGHSVFDIMLACGIESPTVFYRAFRRTYGMNPSDYRRTLR
jgi:AraC-like DNA-binding protein